MVKKYKIVKSAANIICMFLFSKHNNKLSLRVWFSYYIFWDMMIPNVKMILNYKLQQKFFFPHQEGVKMNNKRGLSNYLIKYISAVLFTIIIFLM